MLSIAQCAERKNVSVTSIWRWVTVGYKGKKLYAQKVCGQYRINENTFEQYVSESGGR